METHRTGGMTVIAVLDIVVGGTEILAGLFQLVGTVDMMPPSGSFGILETVRTAFALPILAAGVVGIIAGIGMLALRSWARTVSLAFSGLLILTSVFLLFLTSALTLLLLPVLASIDGSDPTTAGLILFAVVYVALPVSYAFVLWIAFSRPAWRATFAKG